MPPLASQLGAPTVWRARDPEPELVRSLAAELLLEPVVATTLANRQVESVGDARRFLDPHVEDLRDPFELADMDKAADRLARAVRDGETVLVYGDADVDGLSGTALLMHFMRFLGMEPRMHVPNRAFEGYSFTEAGIEAVLEQEANVVISVDNGTSSIEEVAILQDHGVDVIITDHHQPHEKLPPAHAVVNPHRADCPYPFKGLSGVGVAFKLACAVASRLREGQKRSPEMARFLGEAMAWVAMGTVSDMMPLQDENRILVKRGLRAIPLTTHPGLAALCKIAGVDKQDFRAEDIAFKLAPRLNAATRMGRTDVSLALLTSNDAAAAPGLAKQLDDLNKQRQAADRAMFDEIRNQLDDMPAEEPVILRNDHWNAGLLGLVASRIVQQVGRPAALVSGKTGDPAKGSMRTVKGFDAHAALGRCSEHLEGHGGHAMAAGFSMRLENFEAFRDSLRQAWTEHLDAGWKPPPLEYDAELALPGLTRRVVEQLETLAPFGQSNPRPSLVATGVTIRGLRRLGDDASHLELELGHGPAAVRAMAFGSGHRAEDLRVGQVIDVLFVPRINRFRGRNTVEMELLDLRTAADGARG